MKKFVRRLRKSFRYGEKGFTLIELLVVVAILGVLAAVVVPNVVSFMGSGTEDAANTEMHDVQLAVVAYMADNNVTTADGTVGPASEIQCATCATGTDDFLVSPEKLQSDYTIASGEITGVANYDTGKWKDLSWSTALGWYEP